MARSNTADLVEHKNRLLPIRFTPDAFEHAARVVLSKEFDACPRCQSDSPLFDNNLLCCRVRELANDPRTESRRATAIFYAKKHEFPESTYRDLLTHVVRFHRMNADLDMAS